MASLKTIRRRISSAKSTQQITRALKLVSAARLRRAQEALVNALPYSEALARVANRGHSTFVRGKFGPRRSAVANEPRKQHNGGSQSTCYDEVNQ